MDPKRRTITVAPFRDRVVHHALIAAIAPTLERGMDPDSFGCRAGKGTDGALARAQALARRHPWVLRADVAAFFASVPHDVLLGQVARLFKDGRLLCLLDRIVRAGGESGRGLPIGHLTSQWLANLYLTPLDRHLRRRPEVLGYARYMDDLVIFGPSAAALRGTRAALAAFLAEPLGLALNPRATQSHRVRDGFPFLGFRVRRGGLGLRASTWRRLRSGVAERERTFRRGDLDEAGLAASVQSTLAHVARVDARGLRRAWLARQPPVVW
ncbi:MAG: reverse transcriptase/maturase family protein [Planctomycetes bacterium]|nr:reverse transcriptase/maturase family protein [Planctomycetota bacterium]